MWELIVNVGRDPVTGRRRSTTRTFRGTARQADTALAQLVVTTGRHGPGTDAPFATLVEAWLDLVADDLSPTTVQGYRRILRNQIAPGIGKRPVAKITTPELDRYYRALIDGGLSPATVRQVHAVVRRSFRQAIRWGWLSTNPAAEATPPRLRRSTVSPPSPEQVSALLVAATADDPAFGALLRLAAATGARRGELVGLRASRLSAGAVLIERTIVDVDDPGDEVVVVSFEGRLNKKTGVRPVHYLVDKDTKTHQARPVAIDAATAAVVAAHLERCEQLADEWGVARVADPFVFTPDVDPSGRLPIRPDVVSDRFRRLAKVHAPGCRFHDLRHFTATQLLAAGTPVKTVSARLGHGSAAMTLDVYGHAVPAADQAAADVLGGMLG